MPTTIDPEKQELATALFGAWSSGNPDAPAEFVTEDLVLFDTGVNEKFHGWEAAKAFFAEGLQSFPDLRFALHDFWQTEADDVIAVRWNMLGTSSESGNGFDIPGISMMRIRDGKVCEETDYYSAAEAVASHEPEG